MVDNMCVNKFFLSILKVYIDYRIADAPTFDHNDHQNQQSQFRIVYISLTYNVNPLSIELGITPCLRDCVKDAPIKMTS